MKMEFLALLFVAGISKYAQRYEAPQRPGSG